MSIWAENPAYDARLLASGDLSAPRLAAQMTEEFGVVFSDSAVDHRRRLLRRQSDGEAKAPGQRVVIPAASGYVGPTIGFFDLETTFSSQPRILTCAIADGFGRVTELNLDTHPGSDWLDDRPLSVAIRDALESYTTIAGWNSKLFDVPVLNGRLRFHGERPVNPQTHIDLMYYASGQFMRIGRRSLDNVSKFFQSPNRKTELDVQTWERADHGDRDAYQLIKEHNRADALVTRDVWAALGPMVRNIHRGG